MWLVVKKHKKVKLAVCDVDGVLRGKFVHVGQTQIHSEVWIWFLQCGLWMGQFGCLL